MGLRKLFSKFDDYVLHPVKESIQDVTSRSAEMKTKALQSILPDSLQGSWTTEIPKLTDTGRILEKDYWEQPAASFAGNVDSFNSVAPRAVRPYAVPIEAAALSVFNPYAGAAFLTAYNAGKAQQNDTFNWSDTAKDAAINFGTAAIGNYAKGVANAGSGNVNAMTPTSATSASGTAGATQAFNQGASSALRTSAAAVTPGQVAQSGVGSFLRQATAKAASGVANQALTQTLQPKMADSISGIYDGGAPEYFTNEKFNLQDSALGRFGGQELLKSPTEAATLTITQDDLNNINARIAAQNEQRKMDITDKFRSAGFSDYSNDPRYQAQVDALYKSSAQEAQEAYDEANRLNQYNALKTHNNLDDTQMLDYINQTKADPTWQYASLFQPFIPMVR
jgi:hypothetical protein